MTFRKSFITIAFVLAPVLVWAQASPNDPSPFAVHKKLNKRRSFLWPELLSVVAPGADQWWEGQYGAAAGYTGAAVAGYGLLLSSDPNSLSSATFDSLNDQYRSAELGAQIAQDSGFLSAYHSFRTAVTTRRDDFSFLKHEETDGELLLAPFNYKFLIRPTTFISLIIFAAVDLIEAKQDGNHNLGATTLSDDFFAGSYAYCAGTSEEAAFRGWLLPVGMYYTKSEVWSNLATSTLFAAAHLSTVSFPVFQFAVGYYLGWLSQRNEWTIGEGIFIHTWLDVMAFLADYAWNRNNQNSSFILPMSFTF